MSNNNIVNEYNHGAFCILKNEVVQPDRLEVWKPIKGFEERYWISNIGRVLSVLREITTKYSSKRTYQWKLLKLTPKTNGYTRVKLCRGDGRKYEDHLVHRLVASHFIPNPEQLPVVNHVNEIRHENHVENLEWVTVQTNLTHNDCHLRGAENRRKPVFQLDHSGGVIQRWDSVDAAHAAGFFKGSIRKVCYGELNRHKGYNWSYEMPSP